MDTQEATPAGSVNLDEIPPLDIATLTLGEMADLEADSGRSFEKLLAAGNATRQLVRVWVNEQRTSEKPRSWRELSALRVFGP